MKVMKKLIYRFITRMIHICPPCTTPIIYIKINDKIMVA